MKGLVEPREVLPMFRAAIKVQYREMIGFIAATILFNASHFLLPALQYLDRQELSLLETFYFKFFRIRNIPQPRKINLSLKAIFDQKADEMANDSIGKAKRKRAPNSPSIRSKSPKVSSQRSPPAIVKP